MVTTSWARPPRLQGQTPSLRQLSPACPGRSMAEHRVADNISPQLIQQVQIAKKNEPRSRPSWRHPSGPTQAQTQRWSQRRRRPGHERL